MFRLKIPLDKKKYAQKLSVVKVSFNNQCLALKFTKTLANKIGYENEI